MLLISPLEAAESHKDSRTRALRVLDSLREATHAAKLAATVLLGPAAAADTAQQLAAIASERLLPNFSFLLLSQLAAEHAEGPHGGPSTQESKRGPLLAEGDVLRLSELGRFAVETMLEVKRLLDLSRDSFLVAVQAGLVRVAAPLRQSLAVAATMENREASLRAATQLLTLDNVSFPCPVL